MIEESTIDSNVVLCANCNKPVPIEKIRNYANDVKDKFKHHFCDVICKRRFYSKQSVINAKKTREVIKKEKMDFTNNISIEQLKMITGEDALAKIVALSYGEISEHILVHNPSYTRDDNYSEHVLKPYFNLTPVISFVATCRQCKKVIGRSHGRIVNRKALKEI